jgi:long-chain acyl-CoA synthetase
MTDHIQELDQEMQRPEFESMVHMLAHAAKEYPDHTAIICGDDEITFADYYACVAGLASNLIDMGAKNERVIILKANSIETAVAANAVWAAGAQVIMFNPLYTESELRPLIEDAAPTIILCDTVHEEVMTPLSEANDVTHFYTFDDKRIAIDQWRGNRSLKLPRLLPKKTDLALLAYTGGTTGLPKGAMHTHAMMLAMAKSMDGLYSTLIAGDIWLNVAPVSHIWGWCVSLVAPMYCCNTIVLVPKFIPDAVISEITRTKATIFAGGPSVIYNALLAVPNLKETDFSQVRLCLGGGSAFAEATIAAWEDASGNTVHELWGMSEAAPLSGNPSDRPNKIGSVGLPCVMTDIEAVDPETGVNIMPTDEAGELRIRGPQMITSYWNRPEETADTIRDGWLYTGDIGSIDSLGRITIVDRKKDMVNVGGYNVFPREIDEILFTHSDIQEAAAIGVPDAHRGEAIQAFVVITQGTSVTAEEIIDYCKEKLAKFKVPSVVNIVPSLPKTPAAKIDKIALRKYFEVS